MKYRATQTAWYNMQYLQKGMEFEAPEGFSAPWAEAIEVAEVKPTIAERKQVQRQEEPKAQKPTVDDPEVEAEDEAEAQEFEDEEEPEVVPEQCRSSRGRPRKA